MKNLKAATPSIFKFQYIHFLLAFFFTLSCFSSFGYANQKDWQDTLGSIAVQQGGRVKPFETFAKEAVLFMTGESSWNKQPVVETVWRWMATPEKWENQPIISVSAPEIREEFGLKLIKKRVSAEVVLGEKSFTQKVRDAMHRQQKKEAVSFNDKQRVEIYEKAVFLSQLGAGQLPGWIPEPNNPQGAWMKFSDFSLIEPKAWMIDLPTAETEAFKNKAEAFAATFQGVEKSDDIKDKAAIEFEKALDAVLSKAGLSIDQKSIDRELFYNQLHAFGRGSKLYLMAALFFFVAALSSKRVRKRDYPFILGLGIYSLAILLHIVGFYFRTTITGRAPVTNMYESIVWVSLAAAIFAIPIYAYLRNISVMIMAALVSAFGLLVAESFPAVLDPALSPLVPVLRSNLWLTVHVLTITMSYGAFALAWALGHVVVLGLALRKQNEGLVAMANAVYRAIQIGVVLLAAGTVLGGVWANYSWGRFWGWDPKETWALIALLGYLVVLHGRFIGWFGSFGIAMGAILAFMGVVMAWYGVNFVLAAGLHSYGFGGGGYSAVSTVVIIDLVLVGLAGWRYHKKKKALG